MKVGDKVRWQPKGRPGFKPLAIANCEILDFGEGEFTGEPAAKIKLPPPFNDEVGVLLQNLEPQD